MGALIPPNLVPWIVGIFGAFIGSFVNVCILRMPAHRSIVFPGSSCPACGTAIPPWHNLPVISWFVLRGRCASCAAPISFRYPLIEALTALLFVAAWFRFGAGLALTEALVFLAALVILFFTDLDERVLPDLVTLPMTGAGLVFAIFRPGWPFASPGAGFRSLREVGFSLAAALGGAATFWLLGRLWRILRPEIDTAIGLGDVKLMAMIGAFLGVRLTILTVFLGSLAGTALFVSVWAVSAALPRSPTAAPAPLRPLLRGLESAGFLIEGRSAGLKDQIPFGSLLVIGAGVSLFLGEATIRAYMALAGLASD